MCISLGCRYIIVSQKFRDLVKIHAGLCEPGCERVPQVMKVEILKTRLLIDVLPLSFRGRRGMHFVGVSVDNVRGRKGYDRL